MMRRHAELLPSTWERSAAARSSASTSRGTSRATPLAGTLRRDLALVSTLAELDELLAHLDPEAEFPVVELGTPRGRQGSPAQECCAAGGLARRHRRHRLRRT